MARTERIDIGQHMSVRGNANDFTLKHLGDHIL
eukprot:COSAG01_NODE_89_length_27311_cov_22.687061_1_plen_33_part_00